MPQQDASEPQTSPPRLLIAVIVGGLVVTIGVIATVIVLAGRIATTAEAPDTGPVAVPAAPVPGAAGQWCTDFAEHYPDTLADRPRRELVASDPAAAAWGDPPVIARCGLMDPAELTCAAPLTQMTDADGVTVAWLRLQDGADVTYIAVDRPVRIAVSLSVDAGIGAVQEMTEIVGRVLPEQPVCTRGVVTPADND